MIKYQFYVHLWAPLSDLQPSEPRNSTVHEQPKFLNGIDCTWHVQISASGQNLEMKPALLRSSGRAQKALWISGSLEKLENRTEKFSKGYIPLWVFLGRIFKFLQSLWNSHHGQGVSRWAQECRFHLQILSRGWDLDVPRTIYPIQRFRLFVDSGIWRFRRLQITQGGPEMTIKLIFNHFYSVWINLAIKL